MSLNICRCPPLFTSKTSANRYYHGTQFLSNTEIYIHFISISLASSPLHFYEKMQLYLKKRFLRELSTIKPVGNAKGELKNAHRNACAGCYMLLL